MKIRFHPSMQFFPAQWNSVAIWQALKAKEKAEPALDKAGDAAAELAVWRDWLIERGVTQVVLLGHSRGALQMAEYAAAEPSTAEAVVLLAPPAPPDGRHAERYRARFDDDLAARVREAEALVAADRGDETLTGVGFLYCDDARVTAAAFLSYYGPAAPSDVRDFLRDSARPVLVIAGSEDEISAGLPAAIADLAAGRAEGKSVIVGQASPRTIDKAGRRAHRVGCREG